MSFCVWLISPSIIPSIFIGRSDAEAEAPIVWPPDAKSQLIGKDPDAGKDWRQEEKWAAESEKVAWYHRFNGHEFEQTPGDNEGQGSLACCTPLGHKESDTTKQQCIPGLSMSSQMAGFLFKDWIIFMCVCVCIHTM